MQIGDVHAHLFNAADLPVVGFLDNVLLPAYLSAWEPLWPALRSLSALLKTLAVSAANEHAHLGHSRLLSTSNDVSPGHFADVIVQDIEKHTDRPADETARIGPAATLRESYELLERLLAEAGRLQGFPSRRRSSNQGSLADTGTVSRSFVASLALAGSEAVQTPPDPSLLMPGWAPDTRALLQLPSIWDGIKWIYALIQPRCSHVRKYLDSMDSTETRTTRVVNLLVDYDQWVGDRPAADSGTVEQLKFWTAYRDKARDRLMVETFAPYDPLREAEDRLRNGKNADYFKQVMSWGEGTAPEIQIAGYKLYPPMGFRAKGNISEPPKERAGAIIRKRWADAKWPIATFGPELETSLNQFFDFCGEKNIPILAHARNSNEASLDAGNNANPSFWLERALSSSKPLRICLAHFSPENPPDQWGTDIYHEILRSNEQGRSQIYFDLAFADELLDGNAKGLMELVGSLCAKSDPDCRWFAFGTDWIMLAQLHEVERYIPELMRAARSVKFWSEQPRRLENLLRNNLDRFLQRS